MKGRREFKRRNSVIIILSVLVVSGLAALASGSAFGRSSSGSATISGTLRIFAFEDDLDPHVLNGFKKLYPNVKLETAAFGGSDEAVAKIRAGFKTDIVDVCVRDTPRMVKANTLQPIDPKRITDWASLSSALQGGFTIKGKPYVVSQTGGFAGIVYNPKKLPGGITSYKQLFTDPRLKGAATIEANPYYSIAVAALAMGYKHPYSLTNADLKKVVKFFVAHRSNFRHFYSGDSDFLNLFQNGEIIAGQGFPDYPISLAKDHVTAKYVSAKEGNLTWECGFGIAKNSANVDAAYAFLNFETRPATQAYYAKRYSYLVSNKKTLKLLPKSLIKAIGLDNPKQLETAIPTQIAPNYDKWLLAWRQIQTS